MATHSSIPFWRIPWTEKPGGLQSMASQRIRWDWSDLAGMHAHMNQRLCFESSHLLKGSGIWAMLTLAKYQTKTQARGLQLWSYIWLCLHFQASKLQECLAFFFFLRYSTKSNCGVKCVPSKSPGNITGTALIQRGSYYPSLTAITIFSAPTNKTQFWNTLHP